MSVCPCDVLVVPQLHIPAGLSALPRQIRAFPEIRRALLAAIPQQPALREWRARNSQDLGLMLIDMWAYVSDVLAFYDERIANEIYLRTAVRRPSLRRLVGLLGYVPSPGQAGVVTLAAIAEGRTTVTLPAGTGFRSDAFGTEPPQVFELTQDTDIHPLKNEWTIGPQPSSDITLQPTPSEAAQGIEVGPGVSRSFLVFQTTGFGLSKNRLALVTVVDDSAITVVTTTTVKNITSFGGKDGKTYNEVEFASPIFFPPGAVSGADVSVQVSTTKASVSANNPFNDSDGDMTPLPENSNTAFLDAFYRQLRNQDPVVVSIADQPPQATTISIVSQASVVLLVGSSTTTVGSDPPIVTEGTNLLSVSKVVLSTPGIGGNGLFPTGTDPTSVSFQFGFVDAGVVTGVGRTELTPQDFGSGVLVSGIVQPPPDATPSGNSFLVGPEFLVADLDKTGVDFPGTLRVDSAGHATLTASNPDVFPTFLKTPVTAYGNLLTATRGESVNGEVLGSGNASLSGQQFKLKKKPLTYVPADNDVGRTSTLSIFVEGVRWNEVATFFNCGPQSPVYIVRPDDDQNTIITFGDGVRGSRLPSGVGNVIANYRFGSGKKAPPAGAIQQIAKSVIGLRAVRSPVAAFPGKDADTADEIRQVAPRKALLFKRLVSTDDFQGYASLYAGVVQATAAFVWIADKQQPGVAVTVIGDVDTGKLQKALIALGEQSLNISVTKATAIPIDLVLNLEVDTRFNSPDVLAAVVSALTDPATGPLAPAQASIGGQFLASPIYETVQGVEGVISLQSASISLEVPESDVTLDLNLGADRVVCVPASSYFDFVGPGADVTAKSAPLQGPASASRGEEC